MLPARVALAGRLGEALCRVLRLSPGYWLRAQVAYDTEVASVELADVLDTLQPLVGC